MSVARRIIVSNYLWGTCHQRLWASTFRLERASRDESRFDNHADSDNSAQVLKANDFKAVLDV